MSRYVDYHNIIAPKPKIILLVEDGSTIFGTESVRKVVRCGERIIVKVAGVEELTLSEVYARICEHYQRPPNQEVKSRLEHISLDGAVNLSGIIYLTDVGVMCVMETLKTAKDIRELSLSHFKLSDSHMDLLTAACRNIRHLESLDLSNNLVSLLPHKLVESWTNLTSLTLERCSELIDSSIYLARVICLPSLQHLNLGACYLKGDFCKHLPLEGHPSSLVSLNLYHNKFESTNLATLFKFLLNSSSIDKLDLRECFSKFNRAECFSELTNFLTNGKCFITYLKMGEVGSEDKSVTHVCKVLIKSGKLKRVSLIPRTIKDLFVVLAALGHQRSVCEEVEVKMGTECDKVISLQSNEGNILLNLFKKAVSSNKPLKMLMLSGLPLGDQLVENMTLIWQQQFSHTAGVSKDANILHFYQA